MDAMTVDLQTELPAGDPMLALLREIARFRGPGAVLADLPVYDLEPVWDLQRMGLVTIGWERAGTFDNDGREEECQVAHLTEEGLSELVVHGRER